MADQANLKKKYPDAPADIAKLMGFHDTENAAQANSESSISTSIPGLPAGLPVMESGTETEQVPGLVDGGAFVPPAEIVLQELAEEESAAHKAVLESQSLAASQNPPAGDGQNPGTVAALLNVAKIAAPYLGIFVIGLGLYYFYFSTFSINDIFKPAAVVDTVSEKLTSEKTTALDGLKTQEAERYNQWIQQFFFAADPEIIDMDADVSGNGLTNFQKYLLSLNPKTYDTLGLGMPDGQAIISGINPWTGKELTENQKLIIDNYFDTQLISDRIAAGNVQRLAAANGAYGGTDGSGYSAPGYASNNGYDSGNSPQTISGNGNYAPVSPLGNAASSSSSLANNNGSNASTGRVAGSSTNQPRVSTSNPKTTNQSSPKTGVVVGSDTEINTSVAAKLRIPSIGVDVPLIWTKKTSDFSADLKKGVVHYPGTAFPGEIGTSYISGHSSGYSWDRSAYKTAFRKLGDLKDGSSFSVQVTMKSGQKVTYNYVVRRHAVYKANDQAQFTNTPDSVVALSTCWPLDTTAERLVVFGYLTQVER